MTNIEWINEIDGIIHDNIEAIGHLFSDIKSHTSSVPINSTILMEQLNISEKMKIIEA